MTYRITSKDYPQYPVDTFLSMANVLYHMISMRPFVLATIEGIGIAYLRHLVNSGAYRRLSTMPNSQVRLVLDVSSIEKALKKLEKEKSIEVERVPHSNLITVNIKNTTKE
jgi:nitrogenase molybdenum-iron protein alpha/beta subunit